MRIAILLLLVGCSKEGDDLSSPAGAARCQVAAVKAKSTDRWMQCMHPDMRAEFRKEIDEEIVRDAEFWDDAAKKLAPLAKVGDEDFIIAPPKDNEKQWGDSRATYRFSSRGEIELARKDGRWYVVDPD